MEFNKRQRNGILSLMFVIIFFQGLIYKLPEIKSYDRGGERKQRIEQYIKALDSLKLLSDKKQRNYFKFNPNKLSYNSWSYLGLSTSQLYSLDSFRYENEFTSKSQVKHILKLNDSIFSVIDTLMYFPKKYVVKSKYVKKQIEYSEFNPNTFTVADWQGIGFSEKQSEVIFNYILVRGGIKSKEELKDIFVIDSKKYGELDEYVNIPVFLDEEKIIVTLNTATIDDFKKLKGIGDVYSKIIVDYRNNLGGFRYYYQIKETKVVDSALYELIKKSFPLEKEFQVKRININKATLEELQAHPYIGWRLANSIVDFRTNFRDFKSLDELRKIEVMSDAYFNKIELYLTLD